MRKILSIVIAILMVSMMIPSMAFASTAITAEAVTGLVAGETFEYEVAVAEGITEVTMTVNEKVFNFDGTASEENIEAFTTATVTDGVATFTVNVSASVPATLDSNVKITAGEESVIVVFSIADRLIGDVTGNDVVDLNDAADIMAYVSDIDCSAGFKAAAGDATLNDAVDLNDAADIMALVSNLDYTYADLGAEGSYIGGNASAGEFENIITDVEIPAGPTQLASVENLYAYYQDGKIHYLFDAVENATKYDISIGDTVYVADSAAISGSFACADYTEGLEISVVAKADSEDFSNSDAATSVIVSVSSEGTLAEWLEANNIDPDIAITVYPVE